ncbi:CocE/NonD family hydrolase [Micromonosporaceae bacterium Da 78-11]
MKANLRLPGRDGTVLVADAYLAATGEPAPVIVTRTAYDRSAHRAEGRGWSGHGFGYVVQDVRGRYGSDGIWQPYRHERGDGADLVDWIRAQPWCDGRVVALGGSYGAYTAWAMAVERPAAVRAVISLAPAMGLAQVKFDRSGILRLAEHATWWSERAEARTSRTGLAAAMFAAEPGLLNHLPVADLPSRMWPELTQWTDTIDNGPDHVDAEAISDAELAALPAATLHIGGWYDLLVDETLRQWHLAGSTVTGPRPARSLVVGPWDHDLGSDATVIGSRYHGPQSRIPLGQWQIEWLREILELPQRPADARVFVLGTGWTRRPHWPPATVTRIWHAHDDGTLAVTAGTAGTSFRYDPADPYPSADPGADRSALIRARADAARYTSTALEQPMTINGTPVVRLTGTGSAPADFVVRLCEITPSGQVIGIAHGTVDTARTPTGPYEIPLDAAAIRLPAGSRLLLEMTGSDFPLLARALGAADRYRGTELTTVELHLHHAELHLPIEED